jgi:rifampicin phosphotransferase
MNHIFDAQDPVDIARFGGKAAALARLAGSGLPIPPWFVIAPSAFDASLTPAQHEALAACTDSAGILALLRHITLAASVREAMTEALLVLAPNGERLAVRSSAVEEDSAEHSFAGQLESHLHVPVDRVAERVVDVWRSGFSERVITYRITAGLAPLPPAPAVLVQRMVNSETAGVAFAADPVSGRRNVAVISAVYGLGTSLVSGEADADTWRVDERNRIIESVAAASRLAQRFDEDSADHLRTEPVASDTPPLHEEQVIQVATLVRETSAALGRPQDIEWAFERGTLYLLQSRPITALSRIPDPSGERNLWDNSNIAESYGGITTPLTFSFAHRAYESVYREFCRILGVPRNVIRANDATFKRMLGTIRGRVYYNLLSWYRVLALLPGFTINRRFMEQMMGVKEGLPEEIAAGIAGQNATARVADGLRFSGTVLALAANHFLLPHRIRRFYARLNTALTLHGDLAALDANALCNHYHELEQRLLTRWDAPLVNDFFAMIFYGTLRKLCASWCEDTDETLQNDLLAGEGGMISAEPARRVREMAEQLRDDDAFVDLLVGGSLAGIRAAMDGQPQFAARFADYLERFGDRCLDELKLESRTLHDDPLLLLRSVGQFARHMKTGATAEAGTVEAGIRRRAEARVAAALSAHPVRRRMFGWVLRHARARVRDRENLRFERTRLFGHVRRVFLEIGRRLQAEGVLDDARDVFYLRVDELTGFVEGTTVTAGLRALAELRREEFDRYASMPPPADRFETFGMVHVGNPFIASVDQTNVGNGDLKGIGCCPGVVRGPVRVIRDPREATLRAGEILVAERTDPGWIMLFPAASGILVERGSLLSHSAIVAREMGIPAVVSVPGITSTLTDGEWVEFDGSTGVIRRMAAEPEDTDEA